MQSTALAAQPPAPRDSGDCHRPCPSSISPGQVPGHLFSFLSLAGGLWRAGARPLLRQPPALLLSVCRGRTKTFPGWPGRGLWGPPAPAGQSCGGRSFAEPSAAPSSSPRALNPRVPPRLGRWPSLLLGRALGRCPLRWEPRPRRTGMLELREAVRLLWLLWGLSFPPRCPFLPQPCTGGPFSCSFSRKPPYLKANTKDGSPRVPPRSCCCFVLCPRGPRGPQQPFPVPIKLIPSPSPI